METNRFEIFLHESDVHPNTHIWIVARMQNLYQVNRVQQYGSKTTLYGLTSNRFRY